MIILDCTFKNIFSERFAKPISWNKRKNCVPILPHESVRFTSIKSSRVLTSKIILKYTFSLYPIARLNCIIIVSQISLILQCFYLLYSIFPFFFSMHQPHKYIRVYKKNLPKLNNKVSYFCLLKESLYLFSFLLLLWSNLNS